MKSKHLPLLLLVFIVLPTSVVFAQTNSSKSTPPKTVVDYFALLPDRYFEANREQRMHWMLDPKRGAIVDIQNGYLFAPGDGAQTDITVCLFKKADGSYLEAVGYNDDNGVFEGFLDFYLYENGALRKVSKSILAVAFNKNLHYELPRNGSTIAVTNKSGKKLYDLVWTRNAFKLKRQETKTADDSFLDDVKTFTTDGGEEGKKAWARLRTLPRGEFIRRLLAMRRTFPADDSIQPRIAFVLCKLNYEYRSNAKIVASSLAQPPKFQNFYADDAAGFVALLIDRGDKSLMPILLRSADWADGALAEVLSDTITDYLVKNTDALLEALRVQPNETRSKIYRLIDVAGGFRVEDKRRVRRHLGGIKPQAKVYTVAQELLTTVLHN